MRPTTPLLLLSSLPSAFSWGRLGHDAVAFIAQNYVSSRTERWAQGLLRDTSDQYLANVSTWADSYRNEPGGEFSAPYHYISADDTPPSSCNVDFQRDCGPDGCVVSAIANYTRRVRDRRLDAQQRDFALRFLVHFVGDIHQPLHNEAYEAGANGVIITFNNSTRNLHATWDTQIPERLRGAYSRPAARVWADYLIERIDKGVYTRDVRSWKRSVNVNDGVGSALKWSNEANEYVCGFVAPQGWDALTGDLATNGYYDRAVPTVELQVARAGVRLAAWLDALSGERRRDYEDDNVDLSGRDLLPDTKEYTPAQLRRREEGYGCGCGEHEH
ncbi:Nuclease S1-like protein [Elsinoe fawcettii]|nr:Nuclease S1-like protein [Elsinoe fawcettii]